jgi:mannose-6-phosphate isomerase-like protein (cupin superfamily)
MVNLLIKLKFKEGYVMFGEFFEVICFDSVVYAMIIRSSFSADGVNFFTPNDFSQQLAYMHHPAGKVIDAHVHNPVPREVHYTLEVLFIRRGRLRVDFYDKERNYLESRELAQGDTILLVEGGHGFEVIEEVEMIEVKQGPYAGDVDKTRFEGSAPMLGRRLGRSKKDDARSC